MELGADRARSLVETLTPRTRRAIDASQVCGESDRKDKDSIDPIPAPGLLQYLVPMKRKTTELLSKCRLLGGSLFLAVLTFGCSSPQTISTVTDAVAHEARVEPVDVEHYFLELWLQPATRSVRGRCEVRYRVVTPRLERLDLDFAGLEVTTVKDGKGQKLGFEQKGEKLHVFLEGTRRSGELDEVIVEYKGQPKKGLWFVENEEQKTIQAWTQGECVDAHWWFPCLDYPKDKATSELRVHMPKEWLAVAAGERIDFAETTISRMEHWRMNTPHSTYLMTLCAGEFKEVRQTWDGVPLIHMADARYSSWMEDSYKETADILAYFSKLTGKRYPYPKYSQTFVKNFPFGGMENISATTMTESSLTDATGQRDGTSHSLIAHEAAHQWFGDLLTCETWSEIWLNEGFATYLTNLYFEESRGIDEFRVRMRDAQAAYTAADVGADRRPTVHNVYRDPFDLFFDGKAYAGGASRLHLLRFVLGDKAFFEGLQLYVAENAGRAVSTPDLQKAMETVSGQDLRKFFDQWFYSSGYPELAVNWSWDEEAGQVKLQVVQTHSTLRGTPEVFEFDVEVELRDGQGRRKQRLWVNQRSQTFLLPASIRPIWVRFDKHSYLPARIKSTKRGSEWLAIAAEDDDVNGRRDAVDALGRLFSTEQDPGTQAVYNAAILRRLRDDKQEAVRVEAVEAFGRLQNENVRVFLEQAASSDDAAAVRKAALRELIKYGVNPGLASFADVQFDVGYSWETRVASAELYCSADPLGAEAWLEQRARIPSPHSVLRAGLLTARISLGVEDMREELEEVARDRSLRENVRRAAVVGLGKFPELTLGTRDLLFELLVGRDYRLRQDVIETLGKYDAPEIALRLRQAWKASLHSRERRLLERVLARTPGNAN